MQDPRQELQLLLAKALEELNSVKRRCEERGAGMAKVVLLQTLVMLRQRLLYNVLGELLLVVLKDLKETIVASLSPALCLSKKQKSTELISPMNETANLALQGFLQCRIPM